MGTSADSIRVVGEADLLSLSRVARSTRQNWVRQAVVEERTDGLYGERDVAENAIVGLMASFLDLRQLASTWTNAREKVLDEALALPLDADATLDALIDAHTWELETCHNAKQLYAATRMPDVFPRARLLVVLAPIVQEARRAFWIRAQPKSAFSSDRRRRARRSDSAPRRGRSS